MSTRPRDWSTLHDGDPVPGDPYEVAALGKKLRDMADEIDKQAANIKALSSVDGWDSDAGRGFHDIADNTSARLKRSYERYDEAAKAIGTKVVEGESDEYASELHRAQKMADKALADFLEADTTHKTAMKDLEKYDAKPPTPEDGPERTRLTNQKNDAWSAKRECFIKVSKAKDIRDDAASKAAKHIKNVIHHDGVRDPGGFMNWLADWADRFSNMAAIFSILAVICTFVPPLQFLAPIFAALAIISSAAALAGHAYDMTVRGGKLNLLKLGLDVLGVVPGLGALKGFSAGAKGLKFLGKLGGLRFSGSAALKGANFKFFNGLAVNLTNKVLAKIPAIGIQSGERITAVVKGGGLIGAIIKIAQRKDGHATGDPGDPRPTPTGPTATPTPGPPPGPPGGPARARLGPRGGPPRVPPALRARRLRRRRRPGRRGPRGARGSAR
ncbi:putative T7SS-secreted protein [Streptomyces sp. ICC4]|uniref:putative T7SS-secreted protein n=1 Tax=Streptomyces sp. ICC4 TaxID=2099584 RepID=UPI001EF803C6|nr:hypothetical protein [Streptomyces sp. ICC4]